jgi:succinyl-diaminopimelate desuccinylase
LEKTGGRIRLQVKGEAAHASLPHLGENAITHLLAILAALGEKGGPWELITLLTKNIPDFTGKDLGIACRDRISGALTCNLGTFAMGDGEVQLELDIRYPLCIDEKTITQRINEKLGGGGFEITGRHGLPPHYLPAESPLVKTLLAAYQEETGDFSPPLAIGGRTYATALGNGVAFGPNLPGRPQLAHQKDEYIQVADLMLAARIYGRALFHLAAGGFRKEDGEK